MGCRGLCDLDRGVRTPEYKQSRYYSAGGRYCQACGKFLYKPYSDNARCYCCNNRFRYSQRQRKICGVVIA